MPTGSAPRPRASPYSELDILIAAKVRSTIDKIDDHKQARRMTPQMRSKLRDLRAQITCAKKIVHAAEDQGAEILKQIIELQRDVKSLFPRRNVPLDCCMELLCAQEQFNTHSWKYLDQTQNSDSEDDDDDSEEHDDSEEEACFTGEDEETTTDDDSWKAQGSSASEPSTETSDSEGATPVPRDDLGPPPPLVRN